MTEAASGRRGDVHRRTAETDIRVHWNLDGEGRFRVETGIGFFDHLLSAFARHGLFDLEVRCTGDLHVDGHHTVEDTGLVLGQALDRALGDKQGIRRFGSAHVPMDDALVLAAVDISGRPYAAVELDVDGAVGQFDGELADEFIRALASSARITVHVRRIAGRNRHHVLEAAFKALGRAVAEAVALDPRVHGVPSTKGVLE
ncbi:MAG: imidazoleglycerol-phosphate dehydratase HisB [Firmicutes bacterium]|nr:imidazoleglycerol-phosphate dehydratase HisB [Bacillota bacterium]